MQKHADDDIFDLDQLVKLVNAIYSLQLFKFNSMTYKNNTHKSPGRIKSQYASYLFMGVFQAFFL
jgi:hypothetical protein